MTRRTGAATALLALVSCAPPALAQAARRDNPLRDFGIEEIVFAARVSGRDHYYVNFGYYVNNPKRKGYADGGRLCRLKLIAQRLYRFAGQDHLSNRYDPVARKEHMLGAAKPDALGPHLHSHLRIIRRVGIGTHL